MPTTHEQLQTAYNYIRDQRLYEARELLLSVVKLEPQNADAWWLLANAQTDPAAKRDALQILLKIRPDHQPAQEMLAKLDTPSASFAFADLGTPSTPSFPTYDTGFTPTPVRRRNPFMFACLVVTGLMALSCIAVVAVGGIAITQFANNPTFQAVFSTAVGVLNLPETLPPDVTPLSEAQPGQPVTGARITAFSYTAYTYSAREGETVTIHITDSTAKKNQVFFFGLYDPSGKKVIANGISDLLSTAIPSGSKLNETGTLQTLTYTFPSSGSYTILISGITSSNAYTLTVTSDRQ